MYVYTLLSICALTAALESQSLWDLLENVINITHESYVPEDASLNISEIAHKYGHPFEEHSVATEDGYIINFHRIPNKKDGKKQPVVFLMHGILECSDSWLLMGPGTGLGFVLAEQGFDVWMGNNRGNKHALAHKTLNYTMPTYWEFTWEEIALYDLPAMIDYILKETGEDSLYYIGYSQGTTNGYVLCSMMPEYNSKIKIMFSLAPEAWMGNIKSPLVRLFSPAYNILGYILQDFNTFSAGTDFFNKVSAFICSVLPGRCDNILFAISGFENKINETLTPVIFGHMPTGSSTQQFVHYGQLVQSKRFCRYDYGEKINIIKYGQSTPPDYDLSKLTAPVVLFYSSKDWLSDSKDVETLRQHLPNVIDVVYLNDFTHIDFVYAAEAVDAIYIKIVEHIVKFEEELKQKQKSVGPLKGVVQPKRQSRRPSNYGKSKSRLIDDHPPESSLNNIPKIWC